MNADVQCIPSIPDGTSVPTLDYGFLVYEFLTFISHRTAWFHTTRIRRYSLSS